MQRMEHHAHMTIFGGSGKYVPTMQELRDAVLCMN